MLTEFDTVYHLRTRPAHKDPGVRLLLGLGAVVYHAVRGGRDVVIHDGDTSERIVLPDHHPPAQPAAPDEQFVVRWRQHRKAADLS